MDYIKLHELFTEALTSITIKDLRKWFADEAIKELNYDISALDTKIIAKVAIIRMKLN